MVRDEALALGRFKRAPARWETKFGRWIGETGVPRIVAALGRDPDLIRTVRGGGYVLEAPAPAPPGG